MEIKREHKIVPYLRKWLNEAENSGNIKEACKLRGQILKYIYYANK